MSFLPSTAPPPEDYSWLLEGQEDELALGPVLPDDYREAPKPRKSEVIANADDLVSDHQLRISQSWEMGEVYDGVRPGYFAEDQEMIDDGVIETCPLITLQQMYDFRCGLMALHERYPRLLTKDANDRDEAIAVEALVSYDFQCEERQYAAAHGASLRFQEPAHLQQFGMLVGMDTLNPEDPLSGLDMTLLDPATVFPVWGGRAGVTELYRVYDDSRENIIGNYGGKPGGEDYARTERAMQRMGPGKGDRTNTHTVTEYWNRDWVSVIIDDSKELFTRKHEYPGRMPFTIVAGNFGRPAGTSTRTTRPSQDLSTDWGTVHVSDRSTDIARMLRPYDWRRVKTHRIAEAVAGRQLTAFKWAFDPATILEYDPVTNKQNKPQDIKIAPGETIEVPLPAKLSIITPVFDPLAMAGVNMALQANAQSGVLAQLQSGTVPPQTSGSALNAMLELGGASDTILVRLLELFYRLRAEWRLELRRDYGDMLGAPSNRGVIRFSAPRDDGQTPFHAVTPAMITRTGTQLEISLHHWRPDVAAAQFFTTLRTPSPATGLPLVSDETARRRLKVTPDTDREGERIKREQLETQPAILHQQTIRQLEREMDQAMAEGDDESAESSMIAIAELEFMHAKAVMMGEAAGGPQQPGMGGPTPQQAVPPPPPPGGPQLPGTSLPEQGIDVGHQGGAPPIPQPITPLSPGPPQ